MNRKSFEAVIRGLWTHLGLPEPDFGGEAEIILSVDLAEVVLRQGTDGQVLVIEAEAGELTSDPARAQMEMEKLLKTNFALNTVRNAIAVLEPGERSQRPRLLVRSFYTYRQNSLARLCDLVSDVISSADTLEQVLMTVRDPAATGQARGLPSDQFAEELVIFNP